MTEDPNSPVTTTTLQPLAPLVADLYAEAAPPQRLGLLNSLLGPVGPLALVTIGAGAFANLLPQGRWHEVRASLEDAMRISSAQVFELARYVEQKNPELLLQLPKLLPGNALWAGSISGALLLIALRAWSQRQR